MPGEPSDPSDPSDSSGAEPKPSNAGEETSGDRSSAEHSAAEESPPRKKPIRRSPTSRSRGPVDESGRPVVRDHPFNALVDRFPKDNLNVLIHFYRGELARAVAWRQRMDTTTHWAIITATALISVSFGTPGTSHIILPFASALIYLLLAIEGRRYRFYDVWRTRVRMLEVHFIVPSVAFEHRLPEGNWREHLSNDLFKPTYKISYWEAIGRRLQRNYIWLFTIVFAAWCVKALMQINDQGFDAFAVRSLDENATILVPAWLVWVIVGGFHTFILTVYIFAIRSRQATGEIRRKDPSQKVWPI